MGRCPICGEPNTSAADDLLSETTPPTGLIPVVRRRIRSCLVVLIVSLVALYSLCYAIHRYLHPDLGERPLFHYLWESDLIPAPHEWKLVRPKEDSHGNVLLLDGTRNILVVILFRKPPRQLSGVTSPQDIVKVERADHNSADIVISTEPQQRIVVKNKLDTLFLVSGETGEIVEFKLPVRQEGAAHLFYFPGDGPTMDAIGDVIEPNERQQLRDLVQEWSH